MLLMELVVLCLGGLAGRLFFGDEARRGWSRVLQLLEMERLMSGFMLLAVEAWVRFSSEGGRMLSAGVSLKSRVEKLGRPHLKQFQEMFGESEK